MFEYLKSNMVTILISTFLFIVGAILGLTSKEDAHGVFFSANYPDNGGKMFVIGKTTTNIADIELSTFSDADSQIFLSKIRGLSTENGISSQLREMVKKSNGPFAKIPVNINLHFTNDKRITGPVAKACKNSPIYSNPIVAYDVDIGANSQIQINGILSFHAFWEQQQLSDCSTGDNNVYDVWLNKKHVETWLGPIDPMSTSLLVKANIVVSSL